MRRFKVSLKMALVTMTVLVTATLLVMVSSKAQGQAPPPPPTPQVNEPSGVPNPFNQSETQFQHETHFLTFLGNFIPESAQTATAYYNAIDPPAPPAYP